MSDRILLLIKGLGRGGAERLLVSTVRHLDRERFQCEVAYLLAHKDALVPELTSAGIRVHCLTADQGPGWVIRLRSLIRDRGFRLAHAHSPVAGIGLRAANPRRSGLKIVYTEHNVWKRYHPATRWGNAITFPRNDHVFAVSEQVLDSVRYPSPLRFLRVPPAEVQYQGIDPDETGLAGSSDGIRVELGIPSGSPVVGTVANFKPGKGHAHLITAAAGVRSAVPDVRFVVVGTGPLEEVTRRRAQEAGVAGNFVFTGYRQDARRVMTAFDVLAVPSVYDGLSIALLEAMSLGVPPVLSRAGGNGEVVRDGEQGLVVPPADPGALARGIVSLLRDGALRVRLGTAARERAREFDVRTAVRRTEQVYGELLH